MYESLVLIFVLESPSCKQISMFTHTDGSREMIRTVLSTSPTARKRERCSPGGTFARLMHTTSADISFRSVYSFSWPDYRKRGGDKWSNSITAQSFSFISTVLGSFWLLKILFQTIHDTDLRKTLMFESL